MNRAFEQSTSLAVRRGVAAVWMLVVLAVLSAALAATAWQHVASRQLLDRRHHQLQAAWLARAGVELAAARLLADPDAYAGEAIAVIPASQVRITVRDESKFLPPALAAGLVGLGTAPTARFPVQVALAVQEERTGREPVYLVTSEARYPTDEPSPVVRTLAGRFRRVRDGGGVRLERLAAPVMVRR